MAIDLPEWDENSQRLGVAEMDATHREFVEMMAAVLRSSDEEFPASFATLVEHCHQHFDNEGRLMRTSGFPAIVEHESEHSRVLGELDYLVARIQTGRLSMARAYSEGLPIWFSHHLATMDSALAACIKRSNIRAVS